MNRRNFFASLCAAIGMAKAPRLLAAPPPEWTVEIETGPAYATYFTSEQFSLEVLRILEKNMVISHLVNREYDRAFNEALAGNESKIGFSLDAPIPARFRA